MRLDGSKVLNPGLLRHQITWERKVVSGQLDGEDVFAWEIVADVRARILPLVGRELENAQQRWPEARYRIEQHYVPGLQRGHRGYWHGEEGVRYLDAVDVQDPAGTAMSLVILAKEWTV